MSNQTFPVSETVIEASAKAAAEAAGFCWENCAQEQWRRDMRAGLAVALSFGFAQKPQQRRIEAIADDCRKAAASWENLPSLKTRSYDASKIAGIYERIATSLDDALSNSSTTGNSE